MTEPASAAGSNAPADHWALLGRAWHLLGPPLRPSGEDVQAYARAIEGRRGPGGGPPRALILGVTPELYRLPWPPGTAITAIDREPFMLETIWPGPTEAARCEDWCRTSLADASVDIVLCDGGWQMLGPGGHDALTRELGRVLAPGGLFVVRSFTTPAAREPFEAVMEDLRAGRVESMNVLKLRLAMSLQESTGDGVPVARVWKAFIDAEPEPAALAARLGWPADIMLSLEAYRDSPSRYHFTSLAELCEPLTGEPGGFRCAGVSTPRYVLGERCPTVTFERTRAARS